MTARAWQVEFLRFTFIGLSEESVRCLGDMEGIFGITPDTETSKNQQMSRTAEAPWRDGRLSVIAQPSRIDIIYSPANAAQDAFSFPTAGDFFEVGSELLSMLKPVSGLKVGRIACGGVALRTVGSVKEGYGILGDMLPFVRFEDDMKEFSIQINRPKQSGGILINRLSKWSVASLKFVQFDSAKGAMQAFDGESAVRLEFDVNNSDMTPVSDGADHYCFLCELFESSLDILRNGAV